MGNTLQNNLLDAQESYFYVGQPDNALDHNFYLLPGPRQWVWAGQAQTDFAAYRQVSGQDAHSRGGPVAGFVNPDEQDFRPAPDSPPIDAGLPLADITDGFQGDAPDVGAFDAGRDWPERPGPIER